MADTDKTTTSDPENDAEKDDSGKLPTPAQKYKNYEADRKRLAEEHANA
jgi:hypothetical protein